MKKRASDGGGSSSSGDGSSRCSSNTFSALAEQDESSSQSDDVEEEGEIFSNSNDSAQAVLGDAITQLGATDASGASSNATRDFLQPFILDSLTEARNKKETPEPWIMKLAFGAPVQTAAVTQVKPRSLTSDFSAARSDSLSDAPASCVAAPTAVSPPSPMTPPPQQSEAVSQTQQNVLATPTHEPRNRTTSDTFRALKASEFPSSLKLEGLPSEDVPEIMAQYRTHIRLSLPENTSEDIVDRRAIKNLRLITKGAAAQSLDLNLSSHLEWRSEQQVAALRTRGEQVIVSPPQTWKQWVNAMTTLFAPANRIALLAREAMTPQAKPNESVDLFSIRV